MYINMYCIVQVCVYVCVCVCVRVRVHVCVCVCVRNGILIRILRVNCFYKHLQIHYSVLHK